MIKVVVSGGFDPVHVGHVQLLQKAKKLGDCLIVIINNDEYLVRKKGKFLMIQKDRAEIIKEFECVDEVYLQKDNFDTAVESLKVVKPYIVVNGGDVKKIKYQEEIDFCNENNIKMVYINGCKKIHSSELLKKHEEKNICCKS